MNEDLGAVKSEVLFLLSGANLGRSTKRVALVRRVHASLASEGFRWSLSTADRMVRRALVALDEEGHPVISDGAGYRIAKSRDETEAYSKRLAKQGFALLKRSALIRRIPVGDLVQSMLPLGDAANG